MKLGTKILTAVIAAIVVTALGAFLAVRHLAARNHIDAMRPRRTPLPDHRFTLNQADDASRSVYPDSDDILRPLILL